MAPAHQRFDFGRMAVGGRHDRLVVQQQLELVDRVAQLADQRHPVPILAAFLIRRVDAVTAARALGGEHRDVRPAHQGVAILGMLGEHRDPDAQVDLDRLVVDAERLADRLQDLLGDQHRPRHIGRAPGQHRKLVAAVARYGIGLAKHGPHSLAHLL